MLMVSWYSSFLGVSNNIYILTESLRYYSEKSVLYTWITLVDSVRGSGQYTETDGFNSDCILCTQLRKVAQVTG